MIFVVVTVVVLLVVEGVVVEGLVVRFVVSKSPNVSSLSSRTLRKSFLFDKVQHRVVEVKKIVHYEVR